MKKTLLTLICLAAMMAAGTNLKAQEVTIVLNPGWNWISFPTTDTLDISEALGSFTPMVGDQIKSKWGHASYMGNGKWRGYVSKFYPGCGYHYKSNREMPIIITMGEPLPQLSVVTDVPSDITAVSAVVGSTITIGEGNHIFARGICWSIEENPDIDGNHMVGDVVVGSQSFTLDGLTPGATYYVCAYMVTDYGLVYGNQQSFTTEALPSYTISVSSNPTEGGTVSGAGSYEYSSTCTLTATANEGYVFVNWTENEEVVSTETVYAFSVTDNRNMVANFVVQGNTPIGAINGLFSVGENTQVYFSQGNLQYQASTNTWRFAENQWDYVGDNTYGNVYENGVKCNNSLISSTYNGWIDMFGWGTSGYNHGAISYQPWSISENNSDYYAYGSSTCHLYEQTGQADWGYNVIFNGGNQENLWRSLSNAEWDYLLNTRNTESGIRFAKAFLNGVAGLVILPDNWNESIYAFLATNRASASYSTNSISLIDWNAVLQPAGVVFLPAAGSRKGTECGWSAGRVEWGQYWTASCRSNSLAYPVSFSNNHLDPPDGYDNRFNGQTVRLVRSASDFTSYSIEVVPNPTEGGTIIGAGTYTEGQSCTLTATPNEGYTFTNWTENGEIVSTETIYTFTVTRNRILVANYTINEGEDHAYVDLGLPSGILWATCNVGADSPEEYGDYFAWGETQPKNAYNWSTYQYCMGSNNTLTKYCNNSNYGYNGFTDDLTSLLPEDDAATANWGNDWHIPSMADWEELYNNTTVTWTTQNGVDGRLFTASNGNSLFLPVAGHLLESGPYGVGSGGWYWSSTLNLAEPFYAWDFHLNSVNYYQDYYGLRSDGRSVRAVRSNY